MTIFYAYVTGLIVLSIMDALWLPNTVNRLYRPKIGHLMAEKTDWIAGIAFYLLYPLGVILVVQPWGGESLGQYALTGAALGALTYATYDLTNQATLKNWSWTVTIADIIWGTLLTTAIVTAAAYFPGLL
jgi:uncharacterized membrane protein